MNFIIGGVTAVLVITGYWVVLALYDWVDTRQARRIRRDADNSSQS
jgi:hypothetical protein